MLHLIRRSSKDKSISSLDYNSVKSLFSYWMASGLNLSAKPGRILRIAGFFQIGFKMSKICSTQFTGFLNQYFFSGKGFFPCKWFVGDIKAVSIHFLFNWGDLKSMFIRLWGCSDVLFEGVSILAYFLVSYSFWSVYFYWHFNPK